VIIVPDYKEMYLEMVRGTEKAINILIAAQQKCEALYIEADEPNLIILNNGSESDATENTPQ